MWLDSNCSVSQCWGCFIKQLNNGCGWTVIALSASVGAVLLNNGCGWIVIALSASVGTVLLKLMLFID